nr:hypothetical protein CFP56_30061 [Quercus suber]
MAHLPRHFVGGIVRHQSSDHVQSSINAARDAARRQDPQPAQAEVGALEDALTAGVAHLQAHRALARRAATTAVGGAVGVLLNRRGRAPGGGLPTSLFLQLFAGQDIWVVLAFVLAQVEAQVVDHVPRLHDVGAIGQVALGDAGAEDLQFGDVVGVGGCGETREDAGFREKEGAGADAHEGTFADRVLLLQLGEGLDEGDGLSLGLQDAGHVAARNDEHVDLGEVVQSVGEAHVGRQHGALVRGYLGLRTGQQDAEGPGVLMDRDQHTVSHRRLAIKWDSGGSGPAPASRVMRAPGRVTR